MTWAATRTWRLSRHFLLGERATDAADAVGRLVSLPAWSGDPELAVALRLAQPAPGAVAAALREDRLVRTFAFGGATHLLRAAHAGDILAIRAAGRQWELPSWREHYRLAPQDWPDLRAAVREAVRRAPLTRDELAAAVTAAPRFAHLAAAFTDPSHTFLKPFAWQGDVVLGPPRDGGVTLRSPDGIPEWRGVPPLDEAGPRAIRRFLGTFGPTSLSRVHHTFAAGLSAGRARVTTWVRELADEVARVSIEGEEALCLAEDLAGVASAVPSDALHLLPGHDQWVRGTGTDDEHIVPPHLRGAATRGRGLVLSGGLVVGSWQGSRTALTVALDPDARVPRPALAAAAGRTAECLGTPGLDIVVA